jgi:plastocyanin
MQFTRFRSALSHARCVLPALALLMCAAEIFAQATITGTVELPKAAAAAASPQRYQSEAAPAKAPEPPVAVVYLEGNFPAATPAARVAQLGQQQLQFSAGLLPIQKGTTVEFPNMDEGYHNVFSYSKTKRFDLGRYRKDEKPAAQTFDQAGVVKVYCEIHEHMHSTILVLDTPYFTKTETNGTYRLENLPAGTYTLKAWLNEKIVLQKPVELQAGKTVQVDFPGK